MTTTTVSSKGQVVLPKPIRDSLGIQAGALLNVWVDGTRIILETEPLSWQPLNPAGVRLSDEELCQPVDLSEEP